MAIRAPDGANKHSEYGSWQVNVTLGWLRCLIPQAGHLMRLKEVKGTCFVKKKIRCCRANELDIIKTQTRW